MSQRVSKDVVGLEPLVPRHIRDGQRQHSKDSKTFGTRKWTTVENEQNVASFGSKDFPDLKVVNETRGKANFGTRLATEENTQESDGEMFAKRKNSTGRGLQPIFGAAQRRRTQRPNDFDQFSHN